MSTKKRRKSGEAKEAAPATALWFREVAFGHSPALVFAPPDVAEKVDRIHRAIEQSESWGEFRQRMPTQDYAHLHAGSFSMDPRVIAEDPDRAPPADDESFSGEFVPG